MKRKSKDKNKAGFTLVELMVVAVIVAILAAVAIPLMSANKNRAIMTEAEAALGTIRSVLRAQFAETGAYNKDINDQTIVVNSRVSDMPGVSALDGRWWSDECYTFAEIGTSNYVIEALGSASDVTKSPKADEVADLRVTLDEEGNFFREGL